MWQNDARENWPIEFDSTSLNVTFQILLKAAMRESRAEQLVLSEQNEKNRSRDAGHGDRFRKADEIFRHSGFGIVRQKIKTRRSQRKAAEKFPEVSRSVLVKAAAALSSQPACIHHLDQKRTGSILWISEPVLKNAHDV